MKVNSKRLEKLIKQRKVLTEQIRLESQAIFPRGLYVMFKRGRGIWAGTIEWNTGERLRINLASGKQACIDLFWLVDHRID